MVRGCRICHRHSGGADAMLSALITSRIPNQTPAEGLAPKSETTFIATS
jgi:hypothetical protein